MKFLNKYDFLNSNFIALIAIFSLVLLSIYLLSSRYAYVFPLIPLLIFIIVVIYRNLVYAVLLYVAVIPLESFQAIVFPGLSKGLGAILVLVCLSKFFLERDRNFFNELNVFKFVALWWLFIGIGLLTSINIDVSIAQIKSLLPPMAILFFTFYAIHSKKIFVKAIKVYTVAAVISSLLAIFLTEKGAQGRLIGFGEDPNFFASVFVVSYVFCIIFTLIAEKWYRTIWAFCGLLQVVLVMQSQSRAGIVVLLVETIFFIPFFIKKFNSRMIAPFIFTLILIPIGLVFFAPDNLVNRFSDIFSSNGSVDPSTFRRLSYIPVAIDNIIENPLLGSGLGTYPIVYANSPHAAMWATEFEDFFRYAHNTFLEMYSDLGVIGGSLFLLIFIYCLSSLYRLYRGINFLNCKNDAMIIYGLLISLFGLLLMLLSISMSFNKTLWFLVALSAVAPTLFSKKIADK